MPYKNIWIEPELMERIKQFGMKHGEKSLIYGIRWSTAIRELIERGLKYESERETGKQSNR